jgi:hypothetical protein
MGAAFPGAAGLEAELKRTVDGVFDLVRLVTNQPSDVRICR